MIQPTNGRRGISRHTLIGAAIFSILAAVGLAFLFRQMYKRNADTQRWQRGIGLLETLIAVTLIAVIGVSFMRAMSTAYKTIGLTEERQTAEILARSQLEDIKNAAYADNASYPVTVEIPAYYSMNITVTAPLQIGTADNYTSLEALMGGPVTTIQEIKVNVSHQSKTVLTVGMYKVK